MNDATEFRPTDRDKRNLSCLGWVRAHYLTFGEGGWDCKFCVNVGDLKAHNAGGFSVSGLDRREQRIAMFTRSCGWCVFGIR